MSLFFGYTKLFFRLTLLYLCVQYSYHHPPFVLECKKPQLQRSKWGMNRWYLSFSVQEKRICGIICLAGEPSNQRKEGYYQSCGFVDVSRAIVSTWVGCRVSLTVAASLDFPTFVGLRVIIRSPPQTPKALDGVEHSFCKQDYNIFHVAMNIHQMVC